MQITQNMIRNRWLYLFYFIDFQFGFDEGDVVAVKIDFNKKLINFSKFGFFQRKFQMEIDCKD